MPKHKKLLFIYIMKISRKIYIKIYILSNIMIIYNPHEAPILKERVKACEEILKAIPAKHAFITGSFLFKDGYRDIDVFIISRSKKRYNTDDKRLNITYIDFNDLYSLFYHSISKFCVSKDILPRPKLRATISDFWSLVNEAVPEMMNKPGSFRKKARQLVLYLAFFRDECILDSYELSKTLESLPSSACLLDSIRHELPQIINHRSEKSYIRRFFYTQAGYYKGSSEYKSQKYLYELAHEVARCDA